MAAVLVAEDEPGVRAVVAAALAHAGHAVLEAADGAEGLRLARAHRPAVVVADRRMPGLDGLALARALKADPALGGARVVLVSGEPADAPAARRRGGHLPAQAVPPRPAPGRRGPHPVRTRARATRVITPKYRKRRLLGRARRAPRCAD